MRDTGQNHPATQAAGVKEVFTLAQLLVACPFLQAKGGNGMKAQGQRSNVKKTISASQTTDGRCNGSELA